jgi:hypothetical protein
MPNTSRTKMTKAPRRKTKRGGDSTKREVSRFAGDAYSLAERAYKGVSHVLKLINIETKFFDYQFTPTFTSAAPVITPHSFIPQGVDDGNRLANSIKLQHLEFMITFGVGTIVAPQIFRYILFRDNESTGILPTLADVLSTTVNPVSVPYNYFNLNRFAIIRDETVVVNLTAWTGHVVRLNLNHSGHVKWRSSGAAQADAAEGHIYSCFITTSATQQPSVLFYSRILYTDD